MRIDTDCLRTLYGKSQRLGVFGGTFDPVHFGHILVADEARRRLRLNAVLFIPAFQPPHRRTPEASYQDRVKMLQLALQDWPGLIPCPLEHERPGPSYTIDTLKELHRRLAPGRLVLLVGRDQYAEIHRWHQPEEVARLALIVVMSRPGTPVPALFSAHRANRVRFIEVVPVSITATSVRRQLKQRRPVRYLCPPAVIDYCTRNNLYHTKDTDLGTNYRRK